MPHVVVEGPVAISDFTARFRPAEFRDGGAILKVTDVFLNAAGTVALVDALVVEEGPPRRFLVQLAQGNARVTVRLFPATDTEKTRGVKRVLALVAQGVKSLHSGCRFGKTNLAEYLREGGFLPIPFLNRR